VLVPATVTDPAGHLVTGLELQEFRLFEDGVEQVLDSVQAEKAPFTVGIVVDASGSMKGKIEATRLALARFLDYLEPRDRAFILVFNNYVEQLRDLTNDHRSLRDALLGLEPQGGTALFDAVVEGLYRLHKNPARKRALLVLSDGMDNNSQNSAREAVRAAKATGIPIYTVGMGKKRSLFFFRLFGESVRDEFRQLDEIHLRELAEFTGGRALFLADMKERESGHPGALGEAFDRVAKELRSLYLLSYRPKRAELDGQWHHLRVEVHRSGHFVRFRPGYLAVPLQ
jgi:VWFA-related protein